MRVVKILTTLLLFSLAFSQPCVVYISGIGCPHCAKVDPVLLKNALEGKVIVIEYEIYRKPENSKIALNYWQKYNVPSYSMGIPFIFFTSSDYLVGDTPILQNLDNYLVKYNSSECLLLDGEKPFNEINLNSLPGKPAIWLKDKIIVKGDSYLSNEIIKKIFEDFESLKNLLKEDSEKCFEYSYGKQCFSQAYLLNDWKIYLLSENQQAENYKERNYFQIILVAVLVVLSIFIYLFLKRKIKK